MYIKISKLGNKWVGFQFKGEEIVRESPLCDRDDQDAAEDLARIICESRGIPFRGVFEVQVTA